MGVKEGKKKKQVHENMYTKHAFAYLCAVAFFNMLKKRKHARGKKKEKKKKKKKKKKKEKKT